MLVKTALTVGCGQKMGSLVWIMQVAFTNFYGYIPTERKMFTHIFCMAMQQAIDHSKHLKYLLYTTRKRK